MTEEKLCEPERDLFEMTIEACVGEGGFNTELKVGILG